VGSNLLRHYPILEEGFHHFDNDGYKVHEAVLEAYMVCLYSIYYCSLKEVITSELYMASGNGE